MAEEILINAKYEILQQASSAMLAQTKQMTEGILHLLN